MRKNLKRVLAAGMAAVLAFSVVGCGKEKFWNAIKSGVCGFGSKRLIFPLGVPFPGK